MQQLENQELGGERQATTYSKLNDSPAFAADAARVMRFLRQREQELIEQIREDVADPRVHDAITADEVAIHMGWVQSDGAGKERAHGERASKVLEHLCGQQRVVCFSRPRMRRGESGEIRLYCTAQHLDALTQLLQEPVAQL
jgi:ribosome-binding factor A